MTPEPLRVRPAGAPPSMHPGWRQAQYNAEEEMVEPIEVEAGKLRQRCADPTGDADLSRLRRRYLHLLESEPAPSDALRRDIRRDLARSGASDTRATVTALLAAAAAIFAGAQEFADLAPGLVGVVGFAIETGLMLTVPAIVAAEATRWRSSLRASSRRELNALLPAL